MYSVISGGKTCLVFYNVCQVLFTEFCIFILEIFINKQNIHLFKENWIGNSFLGQETIYFDRTSFFCPWQCSFDRKLFFFHSEIVPLSGNTYTSFLLFVYILRKLRLPGILWEPHSQVPREYTTLLLG